MRKRSMVWKLKNVVRFKNKKRLAQWISNSAVDYGAACRITHGTKICLQIVISVLAAYTHDTAVILSWCNVLLQFKCHKG